MPYWLLIVAVIVLLGALKLAKFFGLIAMFALVFVMITLKLKRKG